MHQWQREIESFSERPARVIEGLRPARAAAYNTDEFFKITNYDTVHTDLDLIARWSPDLVILDEAQRIKNWSTRTARSVKQIASPYAIVLTGTPLENRIEELVSIVEFIDPFRLGPTFRLLDAHQTRDENGRVIGYRDLGQLSKTLAPVVIRRRKREVMAHLPERLEKTFFVPMTREQLVHHRENEEIVARIAAKWRRSRHLSERDQRRLMIALQRMRMSCDSSYLLDKQSDHGTKAGEILTLLGEIFEESRDEGRHLQPMAAHARDPRQTDRRRRMGPRPVPRRHRQPRAGEAGPPLSRRSGLPDLSRHRRRGGRLNLQHASVVINVDLPWNPAVLEQRIGRVHRIGQRAPVRVVNFVAEGTIEQGMLSVLRFKKSLFAGVLDGGETEVFLGKGRLDRFMESIERVRAEIQPVPVSEEPPADAGVPDPGVTEPDPPALAEPLVDPLARLLESGIGFLRQFEAVLPAEANPAGNGGKSTVRRIEARQDADGSTFSRSRCRAARPSRVFTDGLAALLRSMLP